MIGLKNMLALAAAAMLLACFNLLRLEIALQVASQAVFLYLILISIKLCMVIVFMPVRRKQRSKARRRRE